MSDYTDNAYCTRCGQPIWASIFDTMAADRHWHEAGHKPVLYRTWWGGRTIWWHPPPWWQRWWTAFRRMFWRRQ